MQTATQQNPSRAETIQLFRDKLERSGYAFPTLAYIDVLARSVTVEQNFVLIQKIHDSLHPYRPSDDAYFDAMDDLVKIWDVLLFGD